MSNMFIQILRMSITASYVILAVLILRTLLRNAPKKYSYMMWAAVLYRLCCPFSFSSVMSIFNLKLKRNDSVIIDLSEVPVSAVTPESEVTQPISTGVPQFTEVISGTFSAPQQPVTVQPSGTFSPPVVSPPDPEQTFFSKINLIDVLCFIWLAGMLFLIIRAVVSYVRLKKTLRGSVAYRDNIRQAKIDSPFLMGLVRPVIYIPFGLDPEYEKISVAHESYHLKRKDNWVRLVSYFLLCVHWFNPLCWLAYYLMGKDMEMSCDEHVLSEEQWSAKAYSNALLSVATGFRFPSANPVAFGENSVKERIINSLKFKHPNKLISVIATLVCVITLVSCASNGILTNPLVPTVPEDNGPEIVEDDQGYEPIRQIGQTIGSVLGSPGRTSHGYYEISKWDNTDYCNILYTDYATQQRSFLCNVPGCAHNTPECTSYISESRCTTALFTDYSEKHLYLMVFGRVGSEYIEAIPASITEMNMDGSGKRTICVLSEDELFTPALIFVASDDCLFVSVDHWTVSKITQSIERIWFKDGKREKIRDLDNTAEGLTGTVGDRYLKITKVENKDGIDKKIIEVVDQDGQTVETKEVSVSGDSYVCPGECSVILERGETTSKATLVLTDSDEIRTVEGIPYPSTAPLSIVFGGYDNKYLLTFISTDSSGENHKGYILDFESESWKEFDLRREDNSYYFVTPVAEFDDNYLVLIDREDTAIVLTDAQGESYSYEYSGLGRYALMSKSDFYNSVPNYRVIEDVIWSKEATETNSLTGLSMVVPIGGDWSISRGYDKNEHPYLDFTASEGTGVIAAFDGIIGEVGSLSSGGDFVTVWAEGEDVFAIYSRLDECVVEAGSKVKQGDLLGYVGAAGDATEPVLTFRLMVSGEEVDSSQYFEGLNQ